MGGALGWLAAYSSDWKSRSIREVHWARDDPKKGGTGRGTPAPPESCYFPCALQESNLNAVMRVLQLKLPLVL